MVKKLKTNSNIILKGMPNLPQSKSYIHRYLFLSMLNKTQTQILIKENSYRSDDIQATLNFLKECNVKINLEENTIDYYSLNIDASQVKPPLKSIDCLESGTTLRIGIIVGLYLFKTIKVKGSSRLFERPLTFLETLCIKNNIYIKKENNIFEKKEAVQKKSQITFSGNIEKLFKNETFLIDKCESSQYISGLMMIAPLVKKNNKKITYVKDLIKWNEFWLHKNVESASYLKITNEAMKQFGIEYTFQLNENNNYLKIKLTKNTLLKDIITVNPPLDSSSQAFWEVANAIGGKIKLPTNDISQPDSIIQTFIKNKCDEFDFAECPDLFPIMTIYAISQKRKITFINYQRNKIKESNRVEAMVTQLKKLGANIYEENGKLEFSPTLKLSGGKVLGFNDHRIVMSFAIYSLLIEDPLEIENAKSVKKSYPNFWDDFKNLGGNCEY